MIYAFSSGPNRLATSRGADTQQARIVQTE